MECEVCGRQIYGRGRKTVIEGAELLVCPECAKLTPSPRKHEPEKPRILEKRSQPATRPTLARRPSQTSMSEDLVLAEDYGRWIRNGREKLGLTHEELSRKIGEKISVLQKLETGKITPDLALAKKLENMLRIKILVPTPKIQVGEEMLVNKPASLTLGEIVVLKKGEELTRRNKDS